MRPLNAVRFGTRTSRDWTTIKQHALIFDKFYFADWGDLFSNLVAFPESADTYRTDYDYLQQRNIVAITPESDIYYDPDGLGHEFQVELQQSVMKLPMDLRARRMSAHLARIQNQDVVPICQGELQDKLPEDQITKTESNVLRIAFSHMPAPGDKADWEDVLNFRQEEHDKQWAFRRFLLDLSLKKQSESEIRDDFEWSMNEYQQFMTIHKLKTQKTFVETYVIPSLEVVENIAKLNFSKIAKGVIDVRNRKIELMEAENKAPGKECAYVFKAREHFSST